MKISQESLVYRLGQVGAVQAGALVELREILVKRLSMSFRKEATGDLAFIEDSVQEALLKILKSLDQFEGRSKFTTWATTIAVRTAYTALRRRHWKDVSLDRMLEDQGEFLSAGHAEQEPWQQRQQIIEAMHGIIQDKLTEKQRYALLAELAGYPQEEIGRQMGSNRNAVYKLTHDARKKLKQELEAHGYTEADYWNLQEKSR